MYNVPCTKMDEHHEIFLNKLNISTNKPPVAVFANSLRALRETEGGDFRF